MLLIGLVGMSVALFYVLDQMKRHKEQMQPPATEPLLESSPEVKSSNDSAKGGGSSSNKKPSGTRPKRTVNP